MVNLLEPTKYFILVSEAKFHLGGQRSYLKKRPLVEEVKGHIKQNVWRIDQ